MYIKHIRIHMGENPYFCLFVHKQDNKTMILRDNQRPQVVKDYNKFMGGVDQVDRSVSDYTVGRTRVANGRWPRR